MELSFVPVVASLFFLMDSIGNIPIFLSILKDSSPKKYVKIVMRELLLALFVMIIFYFIGEYLLNLLRIEGYTVSMGGGIILFIIALKMIFPSFLQPNKTFKEKPADPFIVPLAIPLVAGPAILATIMLYAHEDIPAWKVLAAIFLAWLATTIILLCSTFIKKILKDKGMIALERLMGFLLILMALQMFFNGMNRCFLG